MSGRTFDSDTRGKARSVTGSSSKMLPVCSVLEALPCNCPNSPPVIDLPIRFRYSDRSSLPVLGTSLPDAAAAVDIHLEPARPA
jgi:hypothetical protein